MGDGVISWDVETEGEGGSVVPLVDDREMTMGPRRGSIETVALDVVAGVGGGLTAAGEMW